MRKLIQGWGWMGAVLPWLTACSSAPPPAEPVASPVVVQAAPVVAVQASAPPPSCPFPDSYQDAAPDWVCNPSVTGVMMVALGRYDASAPAAASASAPAAADPQALAVQVAQAELVKHLQAHVLSLLRQYAEVTHMARPDVMSLLNHSVLAQVQAKTLIGAQVLQSVTSPKGVAYAQVSIPPQLVQANAQYVFKASMAADKALWRRVKSKKKPDDLAAAIAAANPR